MPIKIERMLRLIKAAGDCFEALREIEARYWQLNEAIRLGRFTYEQAWNEMQLDNSRYRDAMDVIISERVRYGLFYREE